MVARQRAAHQLLDHGSILYDPFAMKILREDEKDVLQFANQHPLASIGRLLATARSRIAEDAFSRAVERGIRQIVILGAGLDTFALRNPHGARQIRIYEVDHPATQAWKRQRLAEAKIALPPSLFLCQSISSGTIWERSSSPQVFSGTRLRFSPGSGWCHILHRTLSEAL
jgi:methyltransferase (TIGR00027 family)